jgi:hypothetical protein
VVRADLTPRAAYATGLVTLSQAILQVERTEDESGTVVPKVPVDDPLGVLHLLEGDLPEPLLEAAGAQFSRILECRKYWLTTVSSRVSSSFSVSITRSFPFMLAPLCRAADRDDRGPLGRSRTAVRH